MNVLSTAEALAAINAGLARPITRQLFAQSIIPLMLARGDARKLGGAIAFDGGMIASWASYIAWREAQITAGALPAKHPYSVEDMEADFNGDHDA